MQREELPLSGREKEAGLSAYARCIVCRYEYSSEIAVTITTKCPQCAVTSRVLDPAQDVRMQVFRKEMALMCDWAVKRGDQLCRRDPKTFLDAPRTIKAIVARIKSPLRQTGYTELRCNWAEIVLVMRWAEQWVMDQVEKMFLDKGALEGVIRYARQLEDAFPKMPKTTQVTVEAEAAVQEYLKLRGPEGVTFKDRESQ